MKDRSLAGASEIGEEIRTCGWTTTEFSLGPTFKNKVTNTPRKSTVYSTGGIY